MLSFQDINYTTATEDEQIGVFERYCKFLNSLDCNFKITINNKNKNMIGFKRQRCCLVIAMMDLIISKDLQ